MRCFSKIAKKIENLIFLKMWCCAKLYHLITPCSFSPSYACRMWCTCSLSRNTMSQGRRGIWTKRQELVHWFILAYLLLLALPCTCFLPNFWSQILTLSWKSHTHQYITERSIVNVTLESLRATKQHPAVEKVSCTELYTLTIGKEKLLFTKQYLQYLARNSRSKPVVSNDTSQGSAPFRSEKTPDAVVPVGSKAVVR